MSVFHRKSPYVAILCSTLLITSCEQKSYYYSFISTPPLAPPPIHFTRSIPSLSLEGRDDRLDDPTQIDFLHLKQANLYAGHLSVYGAVIDKNSRLEFDPQKGLSFYDKKLFPDDPIPTIKDYYPYAYPGPHYLWVDGQMGNTATATDLTLPPGTIFGGRGGVVHMNIKDGDLVLTQGDPLLIEGSYTTSQTSHIHIMFGDHHQGPQRPMLKVRDTIHVGVGTRFHLINFLDIQSDEIIDIPLMEGRLLKHDYSLDSYVCHCPGGLIGTLVQDGQRLTLKVQRDPALANRPLIEDMSIFPAVDDSSPTHFNGVLLRSPSWMLMGKGAIHPFHQAHSIMVYAVPKYSVEQSFRPYLRMGHLMLQMAYKDGMALVPAASMGSGIEIIHHQYSGAWAWSIGYDFYQSFHAQTSVPIPHMINARGLWHMGPVKYGLSFERAATMSMSPVRITFSLSFNP